MASERSSARRRPGERVHTGARDGRYRMLAGTVGRQGNP
jgi:hypothetical protein